MADRTPGPSASSSSLNHEGNRKRRPSNIDTSPSNPQHKRNKTSGPSSREAESPVASSSSNLSPQPKRSAKRPVFKPDPSRSGSPQYQMSVARKSAAGPNRSRRNSGWPQPTGSKLRQAKLSMTSPTKELVSSSSADEPPSPSKVSKHSPKKDKEKNAERRATTGSIAPEVISLLTDDEDEPSPLPKVARPELSHRRHTMDVDTLGMSKDEPILITDSEDEPMIPTEPVPLSPQVTEPEPVVTAALVPSSPVRSTSPVPQPTTPVSTFRAKRLASKSAWSSRPRSSTKEKIGRQSLAQMRQTLNKALTSDEDSSQQQSDNSKPMSASSASSGRIVPALDDMTLGKSSPEPEPEPPRMQVAIKRASQKPLQWKTPRPVTKVKGVLHGKSFFSRAVAPSSTAASASTSTSISAPVTARAVSSTMSSRSSPTPDGEPNSTEDQILENILNQYPGARAKSKSTQSTPTKKSPVGSSSKPMSHRVHPSYLSPRKSLIDVIEKAYASNARSHVDLTQDEEEVPGRTRASSTTDELCISSPPAEPVPASENGPSDDDIDMLGSEPPMEEESLPLDDDDEGSYPESEPPVDEESHPTSDEANEEGQGSSSRNSVTGSRSDVEMNDAEPQPQTRRSTRVKKQVVRRGLDFTNLAFLDEESSLTTLGLMNSVSHRGRGKQRRQMLSPTSSNTSEEFIPPVLSNFPGIQVFSWERDRLLVAKEFTQTDVRAKDLPHELEDRINELPRFARTPEAMRGIFKAIISQSTAREEPNAPPIDIINTVDNVATPDYEFSYTNLMWRSELVGPLNLNDVQGCDCRGVCNPKTCACVARQGMLLNDEPDIKGGFIYDKNKRLRVHRYPIFECNALCGCDHELCRNRVVQNGRTVAINLKKTESKGWGVFAGQAIPANTFVGIYSGEFITDAEAQERGEMYNDFGRTYLFDVDFWYLNINKKKRKSGRPKYCIDAYHAGNFTRYLNHSCDPNCVINPCYINETDPEKPLLTIFTYRDIAADEELCFSYFGDMDEEELGGVVEDDAVNAPCMCGAKNCKGRMWR